MYALVYLSACVHLLCVDTCAGVYVRRAEADSHLEMCGPLESLVAHAAHVAAILAVSLPAVPPQHDRAQEHLAAVETRLQALRRLPDVLLGWRPARLGDLRMPANAFSHGAVGRA